MRTFLPITLRVKPYYMRVQKTTREFTCDLKEPIARGPAQESGNFEKNQLRGFNGPSQKGRDRSLYSASTKAPAQITEPAIPPLWILRPGIMPLPHTRGQATSKDLIPGQFRPTSITLYLYLLHHSIFLAVFLLDFQRKPTLGLDILALNSQTRESHHRQMMKNKQLRILWKFSRCLK